MSRRALVAAALVLVLIAPGCAYYNTFYSARKNFAKAEGLALKPDEPSNAQQTAFYDKAALSAGKVVTDYSKSKWVDDALLMLGRIHLSKGEYTKARDRLSQLAIEHTNSDLLADALYYKAETWRRERKWEQATATFDTLLQASPPERLQPWIRLRLAQLHAATDQPRTAIAELAPLVPRQVEEPDWWPYLAYKTLADAYFREESFDTARVQYAMAAQHARYDDLRHASYLREGECLEASRRYAEAARFYADLSRATNRADYADQLEIRRANAMALDGRVGEGMRLLENIVDRADRSPITAEARFQQGYLQEVVLEDIPAARATYAKVLEESKGTLAAQQAEARTRNLDRIEALRASMAADTTGRDQAAAAALALAEQYLFEANRPDRAVEQYQIAESTYAGTEIAPKAGFAAAWVLERRMRRHASADSAFIRLVDRYPDSPYGRAASAFLRGREDSLRAAGGPSPTLTQHPLSPTAMPYVVPKFDIKLDKPRAPADTARAKGIGDTLRAPVVREDSSRVRPVGPPPVPPDSTRVVPGATPADTTRPKP